MKKASIVYIASLLIFTFLIFYSSSVYHSKHTKKFPEASESVSKAEYMLDINTATSEELQIIPGIGPTIADNIVTYRMQNGPFNNYEELLNVKGIGEKKLAVMMDYIKIA